MNFLAIEMLIKLGDMRRSSTAEPRRRPAAIDESLSSGITSDLLASTFSAQKEKGRGGGGGRGDDGGGGDGG